MCPAGPQYPQLLTLGISCPYWPPSLSSGQVQVWENHLEKQVKLARKALGARSPEVSMTALRTWVDIVSLHGDGGCQVSSSPCTVPD